MDDVIRLVKTKYTRDAEGNQIREDAERTVFCKVNSVARSEFYAAAQAGLHPEYIFVLSHFRDCEGEKSIKDVLTIKKGADGSCIVYLNDMLLGYTDRKYAEKLAAQTDKVSGEADGKNMWRRKSLRQIY